MERERLEEALELLWVLKEKEKGGLNNLKVSSDDENINAVIEKQKKQNLITVSGDNVDFTEEGYHIARGIIRRHRLAERLFADVFEMKDETIHEDACKIEHILSEELTDSVCTFLGHPPTCPHGKPIPRGECCRRLTTQIKPLVRRLTELDISQKGRIVYIVPSEPSRLNRLQSIGITAGSTLQLLQKTPSVVLKIDETTVALDPDIAKEIFVKPVS
ncbi:MAG: DtxR family transcriptional regulator [Nitrospirae bacterium]|nr:MAG: DtxR family transcriptional regulator [Nitrospirota bacterium]